MRKAFSMVTAIIIILLMTSVAIFIMNLSGKMVKGTTAQFQREQSMLLAKSYTEYAIMAVTANDHTSPNCLTGITGSSGVYNINVDISYIGDNNLDGSCALAPAATPLSTTVQTENSPLNIIVDVTVSYIPFDHLLGAGAPPISYHRRSLQKI